MHWIIQDNLYQEEGHKTLIETFEKFSIPYTEVKVIPFTSGLPLEERMIPNVNPSNPIMICGSLTLSHIAKENNWLPGSFINENHDYRVWSKYYGENILNHDSIVCKFSEVSDTWNTFFIRPCDDGKSFSGKVYDYDEFNEWRNRVINLKETYTTLNGETLVAYSPTKSIQKEYRFFVVNKEIAGQSVYKIGNRVIYDPLVDDDAIEFANKMIDIWQPAVAFVIDVALTDNEYKVVEINCINNAGFYKIDIQKFVMAIENLEI